MLEILAKFGITSKGEYFSEAFSRNIGLFAKHEQLQLANARVAIPGMGGVGGVHLVTLVRSGIGKFKIADFDDYEPVNINRQFGATIPALGRAKIEVMKEQALVINPYIEIDLFNQGIDALNIDAFLEGVDVVLDGLDFFNFSIRRLLFKKAAEKGIYVITAGPMGFSSAMLVFSPYGMGFDEYFNISDDMEDRDKYLSFALGLSPSPTHIKYMNLKKVDLDSKAGPSLSIGCQICSGMAATEAIKIILGKPGLKSVPFYCQFDPYLRKFKKGRLFLGNKNPFQKIKMRIVKYILKKNKPGYLRQIPEAPINSNNNGPISDDVLNFLLEAGIQAPSGDNVQPWKFSKSKNTISIYLDHEADRSFFNINQIASIISCGAVIENIKIAALKVGLSTRIEYLPKKQQGNLMAVLTFVFHNGKIQTDTLYNSIWKRQTNRKFFKNSLVSSSVLSKVEKVVSLFPGSKISFITKKEKLKKAAGLVYKTDQIRTMNRSLHEHLNKMIRFSEKDTHSFKDGFPIKNLEAGFAGELFLKVTKPWCVMNILNKIGISKMVAFHSYQGILNSSGVALLTIDGFDNESFLKGGQVLERIWLTFQEEGISVQPMTAITLFWLRWLMNGKENFNQKSRKILGKVWEDFQNLFHRQDFNQNGLVMLFRFGISEPVSIGTLRKNIDDFILD